MGPDGWPLSLMMYACVYSSAIFLSLIVSPRGNFFIRLESPSEVQIYEWLSGQRVGSLRPLCGDLKISAGSSGFKPVTSRTWCLHSNHSATPSPQIL